MNRRNHVNHVATPIHCHIEILFDGRPLPTILMGVCLGRQNARGPLEKVYDLGRWHIHGLAKPTSEWNLLLRAKVCFAHLHEFWCL